MEEAAAQTDLLNRGPPQANPYVAKFLAASHEDQETEIQYRLEVVRVAIQRGMHIARKEAVTNGPPRKQALTDFGVEKGVNTSSLDQTSATFPSDNQDQALNEPMQAIALASPASKAIEPDQEQARGPWQPWSLFNKSRLPDYPTTRNYSMNCYNRPNLMAPSYPSQLVGCSTAQAMTDSDLLSSKCQNPTAMLEVAPSHSPIHRQLTSHGPCDQIVNHQESHPSSDQPEGTVRKKRKKYKTVPSDYCKSFPLDPAGNCILPISEPAEDIPITSLAVHSPSTELSTVHLSRENTVEPTNRSTSKPSTTLYGIDEENQASAGGLRPPVNSKKPPHISMPEKEPFSLTDDVSKPFMCDICSRRFIQKGHILDHIRIIHNHDKPFRCTECGKTFSKEFNLESHYRNIHVYDKPVFECCKCGKKLANKYNLQKHHRSAHKSEKPFECSSCGKGFVYKSSLETHSRSAHTNDEPFECSECATEFPSRDDLKRHVHALHTPDKPFECDKCGKRFPSKDALKRHIVAMHPRDKPFVCDKCGKRFSRQDYLFNHVRTHKARHVKIDNTDDQISRPANKQESNDSDQDSSMSDSSSPLLLTENRTMKKRKRAKSDS